MKTLFLTLSKEPFDVMVTGEKQIEFRKRSDWILSRLFNKDGSKKKFDVVKFTNGYGKDKPFFIANFKGVDQAATSNVHTYSNGLKVYCKRFDLRIYLGEIIKKGNLKK